MHCRDVGAQGMAYKLYMYMISNMGSSSSRAVACARVRIRVTGGRRLRDLDMREWQRGERATTYTIH